MKRFYTFCILTLMSFNLFAFDVEHATNAYLNLVETLSQASNTNNGKSLRSTSRLILEAYVVSGSAGLIQASKETINGSIYF